MSSELSSFFNEVKSIEKDDSKYTSEQQIHRLLRPGSTYANLNPFEVLLIDPDDSIEQIKKQYKKLSILLHPDKNLGNQENAQKAFDAVVKAYKMLEDEKSREKASEIVEEAKYKLNKDIQEKRKRMRQQYRKDVRLEEDDPVKYKQALKVMIMKLFAEQERKRRIMEEKVQMEKKRQREVEIEEKEIKEIEKEWQKNFEESRQNRVNSWHSFNKKTKSKRKDFRPPKPKTEGRN